MLHDFHIYLPSCNFTITHLSHIIIDNNAYFKYNDYLEQNAHLENVVIAQSSIVFRDIYLQCYVRHKEMRI